VQRRDARSRVLLKCCEQRDYATRVLPASSYLDTGVRTIRARAADRRSERVSPSSTILHRDRPAAVALAVLVRGPLKAPSFDSSSVVVLYVGGWCDAHAPRSSLGPRSSSAVLARIQVGTRGRIWRRRGGSPPSSPRSPSPRLQVSRAGGRPLALRSRRRELLDRVGGGERRRPTQRDQAH
jgi:hypothetical protein